MNDWIARASGAALLLFFAGVSIFHVDGLYVFGGVLFFVIFPMQTETD